MPLTIDLEKWTTLAEAAELAGCSPQRIAWLAARGDLETLPTVFGRLYSIEQCRERAANRAARLVTAVSTE